MKLDRTMVKELAERYSEKPTFITYLSAADKRSEAFLEKRRHRCRKALPRQMQKDFDKGMDKLRAILEERERPFAMVLDYSDGTVYEFVVPRPDEDTLVVDNSPYIKPFVRMLNDHPDIIMLVLDHTHARILEFSLDTVSETDMEKDIIGAHKKGGWSQRRYQRLREGAIEHFLKDVVERLTLLVRSVRPRFIIASGRRDAVNKVKERLPSGLLALWKETEGISLEAPENSLLHEALRRCHLEEETLSHHLVDRLRMDILTHHPVSFGLREVQQALFEGRGEVLLVREDLREPGMKCEPCGILAIPMKSACSICGGPTHPVDAVEEMVEAAERFGTRVEMIVADDYLDDLGGIGLLHRF